MHVQCVMRPDLVVLPEPNIDSDLSLSKVQSSTHQSLYAAFKKTIFNSVANYSNAQIAIESFVYQIS